ncbi:hypothetical protein Tco_0828038 [Tanacetum coccineum]
MASEQFSSGLVLQFMTPATSSSGLIRNPITQQPCNPPNRDNWDAFFFHQFDEYFNSSNHCLFLPFHSCCSTKSVEESPKTPLFHDDPLHEPLHKDSTSQGSSSNVRPSHTPFELIGRWTKDHPIQMRSKTLPFSLHRKQLKTNACCCYFDAFLTSVEPKNFKQAMIEPSWIDAMQEEIHEF